MVLSSSLTSDGNEVGEREEEHLMRTDEWLVTVRLLPIMLPGRKATKATLFTQSTKRYMDGTGDNKLYRDNTVPGTTNRTGRRDQMMKFARNGFVVLMEDAIRAKSHTGTNGALDPAKTRPKPHIKKRRMTRIGKWRMDTAGFMKCGACLFKYYSHFIYTLTF